MATEAVDDGVRIRRARLALGLTQDAVAGAAGVSQSVVSRIELGLGAGLPLSTWRSVARAVQLRLSLDDPPGPGWGGVAAVVGLATVGGWHCVRMGPPLVLERPQRLVRKPFGPRMSPGERVVVIVADIITDPLAAIGDLLKARDLERDRGPDGFAVGGLIVVRRTPSNLRRVTEEQRRVRAAFPRSGSEWVGALKDEQTRMPSTLGFLWMDARAQRFIPRFRYRVR